MEYSAGAIIFYRNQKGGNGEYLLLYSRGLGGKGYWGFPKGHIEEKETALESAKREIVEETGINSFEFMAGFKQKERYFFKQDGKLIHKEVVFFLVEAMAKDVRLNIDHSDFIWLSLEDAIKRASFSSAKKMLKKAGDFLAENQKLL